MPILSSEQPGQCYVSAVQDKCWQVPFGPLPKAQNQQAAPETSQESHTTGGRGVPYILTETQELLYLKRKSTVDASHMPFMCPGHRCWAAALHSIALQASLWRQPPLSISGRSFHARDNTCSTSNLASLNVLHCSHLPPSVQ